MRGARLFPDRLEDARSWGVEAGGGVRGAVAGVRYVSGPDGALRTAPDRLPAMPSSIVELPERFGGGFLFAIANHLWRAPTWLGAAAPFAATRAPVSRVMLGLDRVYVRSAAGGLWALDPRDGDPVGLGPLPDSPYIARVTALDGWRAVVLTDLRGAMWTNDAGSTWRSVRLPIDGNELIVVDGDAVVGGLNEARQVEWWEVRSDGGTSRVAPAPGGRPVSAAAGAAGATSPFGGNSLATAIEDGWPLTDGTALVARDGELARIRLEDGVVVDQRTEAFPLRPARCHPLPLGRASDRGAVGFACGEPHGRTVVYRWRAPSTLIELRRFEDPREILAFDNGALAARGPCAPDAPGDAVDHDQAWCVAATSAGGWREVHAPENDRVVALADGRVAILKVPVGALSSAALAFVDGGARSPIPLAWPDLPPDLARALRVGVWLDGFQERRHEVLGGWIDAAGAVVGVEIGLDGRVRVGEYIRDAGGPLPSGRWALGWTASRRGFETTDGGMTWSKNIQLPEPIASGRGVRERACGPVGCLAAGWLRVGWGETRQPVVPDPSPSPLPHPQRTPALQLDCETAPPGSSRSSSRRSSALLVTPVSPATGAPPASYAPGPTWGAVNTFPPFAAIPAPVLSSEEGGYTVDATNGLERALRAFPLAQIYAWGDKNGDWGQTGRWVVRWQWPWGGAGDARTSTIAPSPWPNAESARRTLHRGAGVPTFWVLAESDDPDHALLVARHPAGTTDLTALEADRAPVEVQRADGQPFAELEGAVRAAGQWYVATAQGPGELAATVIWQVEGQTARAIGRVPRIAGETTPVLRLARRRTGGGRVERPVIGIVVDGQPREVDGRGLRWVARLDTESGTAAPPEPLGASDLSDHPLTPCLGDEDGWAFDLPYPGMVRISVGTPATTANLDPAVVRVRVSREQACVEAVAGGVSDPPRAFWQSADAQGGLAPAVKTIDASAVTDGVRHHLRCRVE